MGTRMSPMPGSSMMAPPMRANTSRNWEVRLSKSGVRSSVIPVTPAAWLGGLLHVVGDFRQRADARLRMDLVVADDRRLGAEAGDDRAHQRPHLGADQQGRRAAGLGLGLQRRADGAD